MMTTLEARRWDNGQAVRIRVSNGRINSIFPLELPDPDMQHLPWVAPGLFDLQLNGYRSIWFSSETLTEDEVETVVTDYARNGITRCLPTLITNSFEAIAHGLHTLQKARLRSHVVRDIVAGCHIEGPYISPENGPRGAHPIQHVRAPDISELMKWLQISGGMVRLMTLAPEWPGANEFIRAAVASGIVIALGHTAASGSVISSAIDAGASLGTHVGNGCSGTVPRHDNVFWPQLADDRFTCSVIADGWHVPATMLKCISRCKPANRLVLTSDVSGFGGCAPGRYSTGSVEVDVLNDGRIVVAGQTLYLAGSGALTGDCVVHFSECCGWSLADSWKLATAVPAELLGLPVDSLSEGAVARLTLFRLNDTPGQKAVFVPVEVVIGNHRLS